MTRKTYSAEKGVQLLQAQRLILHRFEVDKDTWVQYMGDLGFRFFEKFASMFPNSHELLRIIHETPPADGDENNQYWSWWRLKWLLDDEAIVKSQTYYSPKTYAEIKEAMIGDELLEAQLLQSLQSILQL